MNKKIIIAVILTIFTIVVLALSNALFFTPELKEQGKIVAFRGGGSLVDGNKLAATGCTAASLLGSGLRSVENTHQAVAASVAAGADVIHLNVQRTSDDQLIVFHDWTLDCATNGTGEVNQKSFSELQFIDAGYGYTSDGGKTFPFRDKGFKISLLSEFYALYPTHRFWLNLKNNDEHSFHLLNTYLSDVHLVLPDKTMVITTPKGVDWFKVNSATIKTSSIESVKRCGVAYFVIGWAGLVPDSCKNTLLLVPPSMVNYFWGFPTRFAARLQAEGTKVHLWYQHKPVAPRYKSVAKHGVGIVTSDIHFMNEIP